MTKKNTIDILDEDNDFIFECCDDHEFYMCYNYILPLPFIYPNFRN
jgi:hypothetical protein